MMPNNSFYPVVVVFGRKGSGKSTFAEELRKELRGSEGAYHESRKSVEYTLANVVQYSFARPIKQIVQNVFGIPHDKIEKLKNDPTGFADGTTLTMRQVLQTIGQSFREIIPSVWVDKALRLAMTCSLIIDDGRYLNEFDSIKGINGFCIVLERETQSIDNHASETGIDEITRHRTLAPTHGGFRYDNNGTLNDMKYVIKETIVPAIYAHFHKVYKNVPSTQ